MIASFPDHKFQFWEYRVSHGSVLIRSPKSASQDKNIDLIFVGVEFVLLPRHLQGIQVEEGEQSDLDHASQMAGLEVRKVFIINSEGKRYIIAGAACQVKETAADIFDSPFE